MRKVLNLGYFNQAIIKEEQNGTAHELMPQHRTSGISPELRDRIRAMSNEEVIS